MISDGRNFDNFVIWMISLWMNCSNENSLQWWGESIHSELVSIEENDERLSQLLLFPFLLEILLYYSEGFYMTIMSTNQLKSGWIERKRRKKEKKAVFFFNSYSYCSFHREKVFSFLSDSSFFFRKGVHRVLISLLLKLALQLNKIKKNLFFWLVFFWKIKGGNKNGMEMGG